MSREYKDYLEDILNSVDKIERYTKNLTFEEFAMDDKTMDAVIRNLEVIGEAVKHLPVELKEDNPDIDWRAIAGLRDILIHAYFGIDEDIIWDVIENKISIFKKQIKKLIAESD